MEKTGVVTEIKNGLLTIQFDRPEACQHCQACDGSKHKATIQIPGEAQVGDAVTVSMPDGQVAKASLLAYALPLAGLILGLVIGYLLGGDIAAVLGAAVGLAVCFLILKLLDGRLQKDERWTPRLISVEKKQV